jgi:hypothetical protein
LLFGVQFCKIKAIATKQQKKGAKTQRVFEPQTDYNLKAKA